MKPPATSNDGLTSLDLNQQAFFRVSILAPGEKERMYIICIYKDIGCVYTVNVHLCTCTVYNIVV